MIAERKPTRLIFPADGMKLVLDRRQRATGRNPTNDYGYTGDTIPFYDVSGSVLGSVLIEEQKVVPFNELTASDIALLGSNSRSEYAMRWNRAYGKLLGYAKDNPLVLLIRFRVIANFKESEK